MGRQGLAAPRAVRSGPARQVVSRRRARGRGTGRDRGGSHDGPRNRPGVLERRAAAPQGRAPGGLRSAAGREPPGVLAGARAGASAGCHDAGPPGGGEPAIQEERWPNAWPSSVGITHQPFRIQPEILTEATKMTSRMVAHAGRLCRHWPDCLQRSHPAHGAVCLAHDCRGFRLPTRMRDVTDHRF